MTSDSPSNGKIRIQHSNDNIKYHLQIKFFLFTSLHFVGNMLKKIEKLLLLQTITNERLDIIEDNLPSLKSKIINQTTFNDVDYELDFDSDFPLKEEKDLQKLEKKINDKSLKIKLVNQSQNKYNDNNKFRIVEKMQLEQRTISGQRRHTKRPKCDVLTRRVYAPRCRPLRNAYVRDCQCSLLVIQKALNVRLLYIRLPVSPLLTARTIK